MKWFGRIKKQRIHEEEAQLREEIAVIREDTAVVKEQRKDVDDLVSELHKHLSQNNFGARLYMQMLDNRR